jgi:cell division initiation protein
MLTPEQLEKISFGKKFGGGYNTEEVDAFLAPLVADYTTLYNENTSLRSKMRVLVTKLEEYRNAEVSMKDAIINTQRTCDAQIAETKVKCASMIRDAEAAAIEADRKIAAEEVRVENARLLAAREIIDLKDQLESCIRLLTAIQETHRPNGSAELLIKDKKATAVAEEISANVAA